LFKITGFGDEVENIKKMMDEENCNRDEVKKSIDEIWNLISSEKLCKC
jgi:hypothetical protein